ncbi:TetR/AcrR family transcriptional regulator [Pedobacter sp. L105]|uniref:TetR/AcrR family transcriptional regulator n=1 Tax=Pedobacter sp. L105 TaxID=1641871 RepID=UPI00131AD186|nr:TetR/AcrR family transcriptional regulator [Pedobacter sp. L105]
MKFSKTEKTRKHIIESTAVLFNKKGYAGTSITDITKATNLTSGSIYGNFQNKEEVALAAFDYNLEKYRAIEHDKLDKCNSFREKLLMVVSVYHSSMNLKFPGGGCPMQNTLTDADDNYELLRKRAAKGLLNWMDEITTLLKKGKGSGEFQLTVDPGKSAAHIIALIEFGFLIASATKDRKEVDKILDIATEYIQTSILIK